MSKQITEEEALKWTHTLRSGEYKQGKFKLENENHELCCLGVGCKVFIAEDKINKVDGIIKGAYPSCTGQPFAPENETFSIASTRSWYKPNIQDVEKGKELRDKIKELESGKQK